MVGPPVEVTLRNALKFGQQKIDCFVLRAELFPRLVDGKFIEANTTVDDRFRSKLNSRQQSGLVTLRPCWITAQDPKRIIKPGKNKDGWWNSDMFMEQIPIAIDSFEFAFPGKIGVFLVDHSSGHAAMSNDALNVNVLLVGDQSQAKDVPAPSRDGYYFNAHGARIEQKMNTLTPFGLQRKGMATLLKERGLWKSGLVGDCQECANEASRGYDGTPDPNRNACCMRKILQLQPDFVAQKNKIQEYIESRGHVCLMVPKFHCELNGLVEFFWASLKQNLRANCKYSLKGLEESLQVKMDEVASRPFLLYKFQRRVLRLMDVYRQGATGRLAAYVDTCRTLW